MAVEQGLNQLHTPFFMIGCVRSGTTMLRDLLRNHPNLACPEETHFLRWGDPFGTEGFAHQIIDNPVLKHHRAIDGISEADFSDLFWASQSKADLYHRYMAKYIALRKPGATRWFDKSPQNIYGALLAAESMPSAQFVHIVRNPLNVVSSLRLGKVIKVGWHLAGINYWNESVQLMRGLKRAHPGRVHELRYEDLMDQPEKELGRLLEFIGESQGLEWMSNFQFAVSDHLNSGVLSDSEKMDVRRLCEHGMQTYGYCEGQQ